MNFLNITKLNSLSMKSNPVFQRQKNVVANGYSSFPMDNLLNMTSCAGYLIPVYWDFLNPGDKVNIKTLLRTKTQPLTSPAMATCIERIEWFAVPIDQLFKPFSSKFYGINDISTDLLPYGSVYNDYLPYISMDVLQARLRALPTSFDAQSQVPAVVPTFAEAKRLCDALGLPRIMGASDAQRFPASVSAFPFAAYHKIYFDHYRLTDRETNDPQFYNLDSFSGTTSTSAEISDQSRLDKLLMLHKRPYMRDYFTSMQVSPLFGSQDVNSSGADLGILQQWLSGLSKVSTGVPSTNLGSSLPNGGSIANETVKPTSTKIATSGTVTSGSVVGLLNPANIRSLFAVEKLLTVTRNAKKHYDMQTLAHFGVDVPKGLAGECFKLGTHEQYLQIGEVIGTATTQDSSLGELAGRGSSEGGSKPIHFEAKCHCVLMAVYSAEPVLNYRNDGVSRLISMTNASDFYKSEFDSLGLQPVFLKELYCRAYTDDSYQNTNYNNVIGWQPRYQQIKGKYNRSIFGCANTFFQEWALNRASLPDTIAYLSRNYFYVWPTDLDNILSVPYGDSAITFDRLYSKDYFVNQIYFDVQKASKMSIFGTPKL